VLTAKYRLDEYTVLVEADDFKYSETFNVNVSPRGYPTTLSYSSSDKQKSFVFQYENNIENSTVINFIAHTTLLSDVINASSKMFRQPGGCFEQVSSSNYPNLVALKFLDLSRFNEGNIRQLALGYLQSGYRQLAKYETNEGGFEWYGNTPPHEGLTAYGLMQITEMKEYIDVDEALLQRIKKWLLSRSNGKGGFKLNRGKYGFSLNPVDVSNAYITWALSEIGEKDLDPYISKIEQDLKEYDAYRAALLANILINVDRTEEATAVLTTLFNHLREGNFETISARTSITNSGGENLKTEVLALTALALSKMLDYGSFQTDFDTVIQVILKKRGPYGFGSTQATVLAYKALYAYAKNKSTDVKSGTVAITVNNNKFSTSYSETQMDAVRINIPFNALVQGENTVSVNIHSEGFIPWEISGKWMSTIPQGDAACQVKLTTQYADSVVHHGHQFQKNSHATIYCYIEYSRRIVPYSRTTQRNV
jgi:hypothetical protein